MERLAKEQHRGEALRIGGVTEIDLSVSLAFETQQALKNWPYLHCLGGACEAPQLERCRSKARISATFFGLAFEAKQIRLMTWRPWMPSDFEAFLRQRWQLSKHVDTLHAAAKTRKNLGRRRGIIRMSACVSNGCLA